MHGCANDGEILGLSSLRASKRGDLSMGVHTRTRLVNDTAGNMVQNSEDPSAPIVVYKEWAEVIRCGCKVVVGIRIDKQEAATVACPCASPAHLQILSGPFQSKLRASLDDPQDRPAAEVVQDLLEATFEEAGL